MEISTRRRSHNGCAQCRRRKVKCDEAADGCRNCARLGFRCSFAASRGISTEGIDSGVSRKRVRQACKECRAQKLRCSADIPECERCRWKGIECRYELRRSMPQAVAVAVVTAAEENAPLTANPSVHPLRGESSPADPIQGPSAAAAAAVHQPLELPSPIDLSRSIIQLHLDAFFQYVYSVAPFDFIHRGSLMRAWHRGTMSRSLICAVAGVASRFMDLDPRPLDGASTPCLSWCDEAEKEIICDMGLISVPKLQILLLLIFDRAASGKVTSAWYLAAHASRIIYGLQLNYPTDAVLFTNQECRRRLAWCAYCMDKILTSSGLGYPPLCPRDSMKVLLPCNSRAFDLELECTTCSLDEIPGSALTPRQQPSLGSTAYLIWIIDLQDQVKTYLSNWRRSADNLKPWNSGSQFWKLCQQLIDFSFSLPADTQDNERSIYIRGATPQVNSYVMIQSRLHTCFCELFGTFWISNKKYTNNNWDLSTGPIPAEPVNSAPKRFVDTCRISSVKHAKILNSFWSRVHVVQKYSRRFFVTDWGIAASVYVNSETVILGWDDDPALFDHETGAVEQALTTNLEILYSLAEVSPYVAAWRDCMLHLIAASTHKHILENRPERVKLAEKPPILKLDVEHVLREARRAEDARFPRIKHPTEEQPTQTESPRDGAPVVHSTAMENDANRDTQQLVASAWPPSLGHADPLSGLKATGSIGMIPQLQSLVGSGSSGSPHNQDTTGVMAPDFATPVAPSVDWAQINYLASYTSERDHFGLFAEGLYGEDNTTRFIEQGILGSESYIQSWMGNQ